MTKAEENPTTRASAPGLAAGAVGPRRLWWWLALAALGCGESASDGGANPGAAASSGSGGGPPSMDGCNDAEVVITDDTNYALEHSLAIEMTTLKDATDLAFDWGALTADFFGKPLDPLIDVDLVLISLWNMTPAELQENLQRDNLPLSVNKGAITTYPEDAFTSQNLLGFDLLGNPLPEEDLWARFDTNDPNFQYPQDSHTFMLMASTGTALGKGARMLSLFNLDPSSTQTELALTNGSSELQFSVGLSASRKVAVPTGRADLTFDWSQMTVNALGNEYQASQITEAVVAHFATTSLSELEQQFLNLETLAQGWWSGQVVAGDSIGLGTLVDDQGTPFAGIDATGTWIVALFCTNTCNLPAPWSVTILEPCAAPTP
jgi:hypothetical protein